jgi:hypothetical protein
MTLPLVTKQVPGAHPQLPVNAAKVDLSGVGTGPFATAVVLLDPSTGAPTSGGGAAAAISLANNVSVTGATAVVTGAPGGSYIFAAVATTWNGASAQLQVLAPDGVKYLNVGTPLTADGSIGVVIGANASVRVLITGTPTSLSASIS